MTRWPNDESLISSPLRPSLWAAVVVALGWVFVLRVACFAGEPPPRGWSLPIEVVDVYDGDTVTVELRLTVRVRLLACWSPELRDDGGKESKANLESLAKGKRGVLYVPFQGDGRLDKFFTFGRVLGKIWIDGQEADLSAQQVSGGFGTESKP